MAAKGDPVDVVTGRVFTIPAVDLELPGPLPLSIVRSYTTAAFERDVGLGFGWSHSLAWEIEVRQRILRVWTDDGPVDLDTMPVGAGVAGPHGWVLAREERGFVLDSGDGHWYVFAEAAGKRFRLTAIKDRYNNEIRLSYREGVLTEITDSVGRIVRVRRAPDGRIGAFEIKNARERGVWVPFAQYSYDAAGDLTSATDADGYTTRYTYQEHLLTSHTSPTGLTFSFRYDDRRRCVETWGAYGDGRDRSLAEDVPTHLADGRTVARGIYHCKLEFGEGGYVEVADSITVHRYFGNRFGKLDKAVSAGAVFSRTYDEHGDALGGKTQLAYDYWGRCRSIRDTSGAVLSYTYDNRGNLTGVLRPDGGTTRYEYDGIGDCTAVLQPNQQVTRFVRGGFHKLCEVHKPNGESTRFRYNREGRLVEIKNALGERHRIELDAAGMVTSERGFDGRVSRTKYDYNGRLISFQNATGERTEYTYDLAGQLVARTFDDGSVERFTYDDRGDVIAAESPAGSFT
ncbi:DUF6531 domain-containing protein [Sorangium cellulosum]|nr:DUF6531 domain-containing protein [Sorangium cellulosum]